MKDKDGDRIVSPGELLDMWRGSEAPPPRVPSPVRRFAFGIALVLGVAAAVFLVKYAIDVAVVVFDLFVAAYAMRILSKRIARSRNLWQGAFIVLAIIGVLIVIAYPVFAPETRAGTFARTVLNPVASFLDWSQKHGWAQRAVVGSGDSESGSSSAAASERPASDFPISISVSRPTVAAGEPVVFRAQLPAGSAQTEVRFYDGSSLVGIGPVTANGSTRVAELSLTTLEPGDHEITAETREWFGLRKMGSAPVKVTIR